VLLPALAVPTESRRVRLIVRQLSDSAAFRTVGLVWRSTSPLVPALRAVAATLRRLPKVEPESAEMTVNDWKAQRATAEIPMYWSPF
jgi:hypothetical protein